MFLLTGGTASAVALESVGPWAVGWVIDMSWGKTDHRRIDKFY